MSDARGRVCRYLLTLAREGEDEIVLPFPQTVLARMLGITQETTSRTLKALFEERVLESLGPGRFRVLAREVLEVAVE